MPSSDYKQGIQLFSQGEQINHISFITKGVVAAAFNGRAFRFEQGDILGICDLGTGIYGNTYTAVSDVTVFSYPYNGIDALEKLFHGSADLAQLAVNSVCHQITEFLKYRSLLKNEAEKAYILITQMYPAYENLCNKYALSIKKLPAMLTLTQPGQDDPVEAWTNDFYMEIKNLESDLRKSFFYRHPGISSGFFHRGTKDMLQILQSIKGYQEYLQGLTRVLLHNSGHDLFSIVSELHFESINFKDADATVGEIITQLTDCISKMTYVNKEYFTQRLDAYNKNIEAKRTNQELVDTPTSEGLKQSLADSLEVILAYSGLPDETCNKFARAVREYTKLTDRNSSEETAYKLRKELTQDFYELYRPVLLKSLNDPAVPTIIKMFLNFGYVDATLAGHDNADYLYSIADALVGNKAMEVYTVMEWMAAIYKGEKEPSRDDFDMDYAAHIREEKAHGRIDAAEEARRMSDLDAKVQFELENVFPIANKVTFGRISIFCPLFSSSNAQRGLESSMVSPESIKQALDEIREIDYSAFYREVMYTNIEAGIPREMVHLEVLPEIVLMPNVGTRCVMWQEMNGRDRTSRSRAFVPMFMLEDLKIWIMRIVAEFRWEYIKRIQGSRWGDITDPSITSEYFDYLQFYRNNRELSMEVKATVKTELVRARNNYKSVFVANYLEWLQYESKGSPRLNKFARKILFEYCPFPESVREKLSLNPQYADLLKKHGLKTTQREKHLTNVMQKITKAGQEVPKELVNEMEYTKI